jgi:hypothetical protein
VELWHSGDFALTVLSYCVELRQLKSRLRFKVLDIRKGAIKNASEKYRNKFRMTCVALFFWLVANASAFVID